MLRTDGTLSRLVSHDGGLAVTEDKEDDIFCCSVRCASLWCSNMGKQVRRNTEG